MSPKLEKYREKRDFKRTPEPPPGEVSADQGPLIFVIQKHAATRLHYDFRLEWDGVLKSFPIPNGPSLNPKDKRLAVMTEDHPMDYASFEGVIPKGEYGGGQVIVWDAGTYSPDEGGVLSFHDREEAETRMREGLAKGKLSVFLRGQKLKGSWTLVKTKQDWLCIKHNDRFVDTERDVLEENASIISGLTIEHLKAGRLPDKGTGPTFVVRPADAPGARRTSFPSTVEPMLATPADRAFSRAGWMFEPKLDGIRIIALLDGGEIRLLSRRGLDATRQYPALVRDLAAQVEPAMVLDGEIVAVDEAGRPSFQRLQQRLNLSRDTDIARADAEIPVLYHVFDLVFAGGHDLRGARLDHRKILLKQLLLPTDMVTAVDHFDEHGEAAYDAAIEYGLEGVVAKRSDSTYESGRRSPAWLKIKATTEDEFVVAGYTQGAGNRSDTFGSLVLGQFDDNNRLTFTGSVGTGFDDRTLMLIRRRLDGMRIDQCPFAKLPRLNAAATWVRPDLVARVEFAQWTDDGHLRAPTFRGLREDKLPAEARRTALAPAPIGSTSSVATEAGLVGDAVEQLAGAGAGVTLKLEGHNISITNLDKELWPAIERRRALTKRDLLLYLARVSPYLLAHMRDRPLTLTRYPNGVNGQFFYQKKFEGALPEFANSVRLYSGHNEGDVEYLVCNNLPTLLWLGQLADIELHTWYSRVSAEPDGHHLSTVFHGSEDQIDGSLLNYPDFIVFDLDPYIYSGKEAAGAEPELNQKAFAKTCDVAFWLKDVLDSLSLSSFVKTTGRTGLHVFVPILRQFDYGAVRAVCETLGKFVMQTHPKDVTMEWSVPKRTGKVFFDHNQNVRGKTLASIYSPRPSPYAAVSIPVRWDELREIYPSEFTILTVPARLEEMGDLWSTILNAKHDLRGLIDQIGTIAESSAD